MTSITLKLGKVNYLRQIKEIYSAEHSSTTSGEKNLISSCLIELRKQQNLSQRDLARRLLLAGYDMGKNVITRIEANKRYVTDIELRALSKVLDVSYSFLIDGEDK